MKAGLLSCGFAVGIPLIAGLAINQVESKPLDSPALKAMVDGLGYETKNIGSEVGKEKYEFKVKTEGFDVPMAAEISPSKNYIWLTANLGATSEKTKYEAILRANGAVQPTQFYVNSKGLLMVAIPIENHGVTPAWMKKCIDKLGNDLTDQAEAWNTK